MPRLNRFAAFALAATAVVAVLIGIGLLARSPNVGPSPVPNPTHRATPQPSGPLGGGLILVHEAYDQSNPGPLNLFTFDAGTGQQTVLGQLPALRTLKKTYLLQWGTDRKHVLITDSSGPVALPSSTDAARDFSFVCCDPKAEGGVFSPQSDRIASIFEGDTAIPACLLCADAPAAVNVLELDGRNPRTFPQAAGSLGSGAVSWSPDGSAVVFAGCLPCNVAGLIASTSGGIGDSGGDWSKLTPTAVEHAHLFVVPVDGSPARELLDAAETTFGSPAWSPDGTTIAFVRNDCPPDEHAPYCIDGTLELVTVAVADGRQTVVAGLIGDVRAPRWSPDGRRIAISDDRGLLVMDPDGSHLANLGNGKEPTWSPDGQWLLFSRYDQTLDSSARPWIVAAQGGEPRLLGPYGGWAW